MKFIAAQGTEMYRGLFVWVFLLQECYFWSCIRPIRSCIWCTRPWNSQWILLHYLRARPVMALLACCFGCKGDERALENLFGRFGLVNLGFITLGLDPFSLIPPKDLMKSNGFKLCNHSPPASHIRPWFLPLFILCSTCHFSIRGAKNHFLPIQADDLWEIQAPNIVFRSLRPWPRRALRKKEQIQLVSGFRTAQAWPWGTVIGEHPRDAGEIIIDDYYVWIQVWNMKPLQTYSFAGALKYISILYS